MAAETACPLAELAGCVCKDKPGSWMRLFSSRTLTAIGS